MKGVLPWLVRWALHDETREFCPVLAALVVPVLKGLVLTVHLIIFPRRPVSWAGSRAE